MTVEPLTLLIWAGVIAGTIIIAAITFLIVWSVAKEVRGKGSPRKTRILS